MFCDNLPVYHTDSVILKSFVINPILDAPFPADCLVKRISVYRGQFLVAVKEALENPLELLMENDVKKALEL